jgi:aminoglycoside phosphotransferase (APT) family kinase protein
MKAAPSRSAVTVVDPFGVPTDPKMPFLARALDPVEAQARLAACWRATQGAGSALELRAIRVCRHKSGRRCLIEYEVRCRDRDGRERALSWLGKARAKGADRTTCQVVRALRQAGFTASDAEGVCVPEPLGLIPEFHMWLQTKVPGCTATEVLMTPDGVALARRIAEAIHRLHEAGVPTDRRHTLEDELRILNERLAAVAEKHPAWATRLEKLLAACRHLATALTEPATRGIHRDFYPAQVLVDGERLWLVDFDLYCLGDPALDVGNFLAHLTEQSLRAFGRPDALRDREVALEQRFVELAGSAARPAVHAYATFSLARHIFISTQFPERQTLTGRLLELCEERLFPPAD